MPQNHETTKNHKKKFELLLVFNQVNVENIGQGIKRFVLKV